MNRGRDKEYVNKNMKKIQKSILLTNIITSNICTWILTHSCGWRHLCAEAGGSVGRPAPAAPAHPLTPPPLLPRCDTPAGTCGIGKKTHICKCLLVFPTRMEWNPPWKNRNIIWDSVYGPKNGVKPSLEKQKYYLGLCSWSKKYINQWIGQESKGYVYENQNI